MFKPFSKRTKAKPDTLVYTFSEQARYRLLYAIQGVLDPHTRPGHLSPYGSTFSVFDEVEAELMRVYGGLYITKKQYDKTPYAAVTYFLACDDEYVIDFLEFVFRAPSNRAGNEMVDAVNTVLRDEGIGYEFSPYGTKTTDLGDGSMRWEITSYPEATQKTNELVHNRLVMPAIQLLALPVWQAANAHMLKAHELYRRGDFRLAITECGAALETTLKIICQEKRWPYAANKDVLATLVDVANKSGLFYPFYVEVLKNAGMIRNRLGAHGQEPRPTDVLDAGQEHAEHMINVVSSHILFLASRAEMR